LLAYRIHQHKRYAVLVEQLEGVRDASLRRFEGHIRLSASREATVRCPSLLPRQTGWPGLLQLTSRESKAKKESTSPRAVACWTIRAHFSGFRVWTAFMKSSFASRRKPVSTATAIRPVKGFLTMVAAARCVAAVVKSLLQEGDTVVSCGVSA
jgi:hypothetical protein